jgi:hypothetical protein
MKVGRAFAVAETSQSVQDIFFDAESENAGHD